MRLQNNKNLNQTKKIGFTFDGKKYYGFEGDTLASALLSNGVHLFGRSFKYHRPRGIISAGCEEPNGIVQLEMNEFTEPNRRATEVVLYEGLVAKSQNRWPSLNYDLGAINDLLSPFFPAGFYYKTFMWPPKFWKTYEYFIRRAAGLGHAPKKDESFDDKDFLNWKKRWEERLSKNNDSTNKYLELMKINNPVVIPRNHKVEEALKAAEKNDFNPLTQLIEILKDPYTQKDAIVDYQIPSNSGEKYQTFCGT